jgi:hypothetical protein
VESEQPGADINTYKCNRFKRKALKKERFIKKISGTDVAPEMTDLFTLQL